HPEVALIILDPIAGFYGKANGNDNSEIRPMIQNINKVCQELRVTIIGIVHENKQKDVTAVNQILGAGALSQVVRGGLRFSPDPENHGGLICASIKSNLTKAGGGLRFRIEGVDVVVGNGEVTNVGRIVWGEQHELTADDVMGEARTNSDDKKQMGRPPVEIQKACELITTFYANGPRLGRDAHKVREEAGIGDVTWKKAAKQLAGRGASLDSQAKTCEVCTGFVRRIGAWRWARASSGRSKKICGSHTRSWPQLRGIRFTRS